MLAGRCRGGWCGDERNHLFVGVYLEPSLTYCLIHGGDELVAALVLDRGCVSHGVFEKKYRWSCGLHRMWSGL